MPADSPIPPLRHLQWRCTDQGIAIVTVTEQRLQGYTISSSLRQELLAVVNQQGKAPRVILDLQKVDSLTSEAFRPLLILHRTIQEGGGRLILCNLTPVVATAFQATRLVSTGRASSSTFEVQPDLVAALANMNAPPTRP
jgi:anti-anti-sigma factor